MRFVELAERDALQNFERGRRRNREGAVGALHRPSAIEQRRGVDFVDAERFKADAGQHDIGDRIERADFVEMDVVRRDAVDLPFGFGDALEDAERVFFHEGRKLAARDELTDLRVAALFVMVVMVPAAAVVIVIMVGVRVSMFVPVFMFMRVSFVGVLVIVIAVMMVARAFLAVLVGVSGLMLVLMFMRGRVPLMRVFVLVAMIVVAAAFLVRMFVGMSVSVLMAMFMPMLLLIVVMMMAVTVFMLVLIRRVGGAFVDREFNAFDLLPLLAVVVHVEIADGQLGEFPLERAGFDAEVDERTDGHVATDAGDAVEIKSLHGVVRREEGSRDEVR